MHVAVTGANGQVRVRVLARLGACGMTCTALVRRPADLQADRVVHDWLHGIADSGRDRAVHG